MKRIICAVTVLMGLLVLGCQKEPAKIAVESVTLNTTSVTITVGETSTVIATVLPENANNKKVIWTTSNLAAATVNEGVITAVALGTATITATSEDGGKSATCKVRVKRVCPSGAVDLGLSVFWASCNLGASNPEKYGGYYQWAGTQDVTSTSIDISESCPYHIGEKYNTGWTKYVPWNKTFYWSGSGSPDDKTALEPADDVAHVKLGGKWRMPTSVEFKELVDNCTSEWATINGVKGKKFTSKRSGYTDSWIFLPAAGDRDGTGIYDAGSYGYYWSSTLDREYPNRAMILYFGSDNSVESYFRNDGLSVRPVSE